MTESAFGTVHIDKGRSDFYVNVPARIVHDSKFNFEDGEKVLVEITEDRLIISKRSEGEAPTDGAAGPTES